MNILPALRQVPNFELRNNAHVLRVNLNAEKNLATGVTYVDAQGREVEQPADLVILGAFQFNNVRLMLLSGIGKPYDPISNEGVVGRNFAFQNLSTVTAFFDKNSHHTNPFIGAGAMAWRWTISMPTTSTTAPKGSWAARRSGSTRPGPNPSPVPRCRRARQMGQRLESRSGR